MESSMLATPKFAWKAEASQCADRSSNINSSEYGVKASWTLAPLFVMKASKPKAVFFCHSRWLYGPWLQLKQTFVFAIIPKGKMNANARDHARTHAPARFLLASGCALDKSAIAAVATITSTMICFTRK